jgi:FtsP/CotA-like multicopper oxidase with cupredoxin domain
MWYRPVILLVGCAVIVAALWFFFKPEGPAQPAAPAAAGSPAAGAAVVAGAAADVLPAAPIASPAAQVFDLTVKGGRLASGPALIQVHEGDQVAINVRSDGSDELHLHGYDLERQLRPGQIASLRFTADRSGRFGLELHKAHTELGALEVYPR